MERTIKNMKYNKKKCWFGEYINQTSHRCIHEWGRKLITVLYQALYSNISGEKKTWTMQIHQYRGVLDRWLHNAIRQYCRTFIRELFAIPSCCIKLVTCLYDCLYCSSISVRFFSEILLLINSNVKVELMLFSIKTGDNRIYNVGVYIKSAIFANFRDISANFRNAPFNLVRKLSLAEIDCPTLLFSPMNVSPLNFLS